MATIKVPIMHLKLEVAGETKEFKSPLAETILAQVRKVVVGQEQVQYYDVEAKSSNHLLTAVGINTHSTTLWKKLSSKILSLIAMVSLLHTLEINNGS